MGQNFQNHPIVEHLYLHIPFCERKCNYCSFFSQKKSAEFHEKYIDYLIRELQLFTNRFDVQPKTIYFGGGTPSSIPIKNYNRILSKINLSKIEEITMEVNPINVDKEFVNRLADTPINRISMGIQSFIDEELQLLGRLHSSKTAEFAYNLLSSKINNISLDLIYGLPNQKIADVEQSIHRLIQLQPKHISTYCLSLEPSVSLYNQKENIPEDDIVADFYYLIKSKLAEKDYLHYEISSFCKSGFESLHNSSYWSLKNYIGFGTSASGFINRKRYSNPFSFDKYFQQIDSNKIIPDPEIIDDKMFEQEYIFLNLRKIEGINLDHYQKIFEKNFMAEYKKTTDSLLHQNYLKIKNNYLSLTQKALFVSNEIMTQFM